MLENLIECFVPNKANICCLLSIIVEKNSTVITPKLHIPYSSHLLHGVLSTLAFAHYTMAVCSLNGRILRPIMSQPRNKGCPNSNTA